ncbi:MAG TPA: TIGR02611 family protein [Micromonosporaceae bacterium]|nr:TIGR02611 family protein [Micromonosporaceae bacterium]
MTTVEKRGYGVPDDEDAVARRNGASSPEAAVVDAPPTNRAQRWRRLRTTLDLIRSNPTGRLALRTIVAIVGGLVVAIGIVLIPLPGPGWLIVIAGLGIWAIEFHWARRLLTFTRRNVQGWTRWVGRQSLSVRLAIGASGLLFVNVVVWLSVKYSLGIDLVADVLRYLATH